MGIGDNIKKAAENAMKDLGGTAPPADNAHAPEPGAADEDIAVHSSISEGTNAMEGERESEERTQDTARDGSGDGSRDAAGAQAPAESGPEEAGAPPRDVPGPAGLPDPDPDRLRADVSEGDTDPSTGLGRG